MFPSRAHGFFQRVVSVVLAQFLLPLLLTLSNASDATLPACCRRDGKHHCAMPDRSRPPGPKGLLGASCPHRTTFLSVSLAFVDAAVFPRALRAIRAAFLLSRRFLSRSHGATPSKRQQSSRHCAQGQILEFRQWMDFPLDNYSKPPMSAKKTHRANLRAAR